MSEKLGKGWKSWAILVYPEYAHCQVVLKPNSDEACWYFETTKGGWLRCAHPEMRVKAYLSNRLQAVECPKLKESGKGRREGQP